MDVTTLKPRSRPDPGWLLRRPAASATGRIFCFPYSGIGGSMFNRWPRWIGGAGGIELCPLQPPGRENRMRVPHFGTYEALAADLAPHLRQYLDRPFAFFGHCAAALPAFETVRRLASAGAPLPSRLVVSAQVPPHLCPHDRFLGYDDERLAAELADLVVARGGHPHPLLIQMTLDVLRHDLDANRQYRTDVPVSVPVGITVLHWADDPEVRQPELAEWAAYADDVRLVVLAGGHYEFLAGGPELLEELAKGVVAQHAHR
jgi:surfactin synthase thioesterase subunit